MLDDFREFVDGNDLIQDQSRVLLAVSGGVDSVVMCHLFDKAGYDFAIAHCNYQLRGSESDLDQKFVANLGAELNKEVLTTSFDTKTKAEEEGVSIQMAARDLRYEWFEELRSTHGFHVVATAHHLDDSLESVIFNLAKGTGLTGLRGVPVRSGNIIRPLMFATKNDILDHARKEGLAWREDSSNQSEDYVRNQVRHRIIPELRKINPNLDESWMKSVERIGEGLDLYEQIIADLKAEFTRQSNEGLLISKRVFDRPYFKVLLFEWLKLFGFNYTQIRDLDKSDRNTGTQIFSDEYTLTVDREDLILSKNSPHPSSSEVTESDSMITFGEYTFSAAALKREGEILVKNGGVGQFDFDKLKFPLKVRSWEEGDRFKPLGMKGLKKVSDFMIDQKIPLNLKRGVPVFVSGDDIIWLAGYRIDERFKITEETKTIYRIEIQPVP